MKLLASALFFDGHTTHLYLLVDGQSWPGFNLPLSGGLWYGHDRSHRRVTIEEARDLIPFAGESTEGAKYTIFVPREDWTALPG